MQAYTAPWMVEKSIRFIKQSYRLENMRMLNYQRLRNTTALVMAVAYFAARWLGQSLKLKILWAHVTRISKRLFGLPDFHYYALADGIARLLTRYPRKITPKKPPPIEDLQMLLPITP